MEGALIARITLVGWLCGLDEGVVEILKKRLRKKRI